MGAVAMLAGCGHAEPSITIGAGRQCGATVRRDGIPGGLALAAGIREETA